MKVHRDDREQVKRLNAYRFALSRLLRLGLPEEDVELIKRDIVYVAVTWGKSVRRETRARSEG